MSRTNRIGSLLMASVLLWLGSAALAQPPATESGFVYVEPDVRLYYQRYGTGTPRIFIPNRLELMHFIAPLLYSHDVVTWDPRGRGLSDRPDDMSRYGIAAEISDVEALREYFGAEQVVYVGISLWGSLAVLYAAEHPDSVAGIVALSPMPISADLMQDEATLPSHDMSAVIAEAEAWAADGRDQSDPHGYCIIAGMADASVSFVNLENQAKAELANRCQYVNERPDKLGDVIFGGIFGSFGEWDWREQAASVQAPALMLYSTNDFLVEGLRAYRDLIPDAGWVEFTDAGHALWVEKWDVVMPMIGAFADGNWPAGVNR